MKNVWDYFLIGTNIFSDHNFFEANFFGFWTKFFRTTFLLIVFLPTFSYNEHFLEKIVVTKIFLGQNFLTLFLNPKDF